MRLSNKTMIRMRMRRWKMGIGSMIRWITR